MTSESSTRTVQRALDLLGAVCGHGELSLTEAAQATGLSTSTAHRLLRTLEATEHVQRQVDGRYAAGPRIVQMGALALSNQSLVTQAETPMARLVQRTGESCYLAVRGAGETALYIAISEGTHSVRHSNWVGHTIPLQGSAAGGVLTGQTGPEGYIVVGQGVEADVTAIAAPVLVGERVVAAMSVVVPSYRITDTGIWRIAEQLKHEARQVVPRPGATEAGS